MHALPFLGVTGTCVAWTAAPQTLLCQTAVPEMCDEYSCSIS